VSPCAVVVLLAVVFVSYLRRDILSLVSFGSFLKTPHKRKKNIFLLKIEEDVSDSKFSPIDFSFFYLTFDKQREQDP
jgi:hypothetical protein